jgi:hypothetical protein
MYFVEFEFHKVWQCFKEKQRINFDGKKTKNNEMNSFGNEEILENKQRSRAEAHFLANENLLFLEIS